MATAPALSTVTSPPPAVSEALATQLLEARVKLVHLRSASATAASKALADLQRSVADQVAQSLARGERPELALVVQIAERVQAVTTLDEQNQRQAGQLAKAAAYVGERIDELKNGSAADRALLLRLLKAQRERLAADILSRSGETADLELRRKAVDSEIETLEAAAGCGPAEAPAGAAAGRKKV